MKVLKNTTIYLGVSIFQSLMSFLLLPVYTYYLNQTEFGLTNVINSVAGLLGIFFVFGTQTVISRLYFEYNEEEKKLKRFLGTIFLSKILWNIFLALVLFAFKDLIFPFLAKDTQFYPYLLIAIGIGFFNTIFIVYQTLQQTKQEGKEYAILQCLYLVVNNVITVILLVFFNMKAEGVVLGTLVADFLMSVFVIFSLRRKITLCLDRGVMKEAFAFSWPILFHALFAWSLSSVNKLIINNSDSVENVGVYSIGFTIGGVINMLTVALNRSYTPWFFGELKKSYEDKSNIVRFSEFIVLIYAISALGLSLFGFDIISILVNDSYREAFKIVPFIAFGYVFNGVYFFFINIFNYNKKFVKYIPLYSLLSSIINIILNYLLIPKFGIVGSAISTMLAMLILSFSTFLGARKIMNLGYRYKNIFFSIFLPFLFSLFIFIDIKTNIFLLIFIKIIYFLLCLLILFLINRNKFGESLSRQFSNLIKNIYELWGDSKNTK